MMKLVYVVRFVSGPSIIVNKDPLAVLGGSQIKLIEYGNAGKFKETDEIRINITNITYTQPRMMEVME